MAKKEKGKVEFSFNADDIRAIVNHSSNPKTLIVSLVFDVAKVKDAKGKTIAIPSVSVSARGEGGKKVKKAASKGLLKSSGDSDVPPTANGFPDPPGNGGNS